ncbi:MAG: alginate export family protein [Bacteroidetes bacterium]|nr:alginate export family protein [Bacteroidota bacterium]MBP7398441.1 alginate export family protein [Chitinophagales bacterium]MBK7109203.1 alginate export family protein [Bacteroidota bacterium]MBP9189415.1 alginate export family protein [Chitinophagales bacterium]MBP9550200.1 alginate export family protein [Chitinophagales bacterium]
MYITRFTPLILLLSVFTFNAFSQSFSLSGEFRPRIEYRDGFKTLPAVDAEPAFLVNERTRLIVDYKSKRVNFRFTPQHTGLFGQNSYINSAENNFSIYEAYADLNLCSKELDSSKGPDLLKFRIGRQALNYDGGRILSNLDWPPQGIRHDAAVLFLEEKGWEVILGAAFNQQSDELTGTAFYGNYYKSLQFARLHHKFKNLDFAVLFLKDDFQNVLTDSAGIISTNGVNSRITTGTRLKYTVSPGVNIHGEFYQQLGEDLAYNSLNAQLYSIEVEFKLANKKLVITPGVDMLSGNDGVAGEDQTPENTNRFFTPSYGINHKFYGHADYFYCGNGFGDAGLKDIYIRTSYAFTSKFNTWVHLHAYQSFTEIADLTNPTQSVSPYLGTEIDWLLNYTFDDQVTVQFGTCFMFGSETLKQVKQLIPEETRSVGNFTYLQFKFTPKFFESKVAG